jgi:alpha-L-rhamnosidase
MKRYVAFLGSTAKDNIVHTGLGDWYDMGPKPPWGSQLTPPPLTATAFYYYDNWILARVAELLGKSGEAKEFDKLAGEIHAAFNREFFNSETGQYATGSQTANAIPLVMELAEPQHRPQLLEAIVKDIRGRDNSLTSGDVGYHYLLRALADAGRSDVVFDMNNQSHRPGYGMQVARGATSLTEKWDASVGSFGSQNHFMLGQINEWFFHDLAGIQPDPAGPGFKKIIIKPAVVGDLTWVRVSYRSIHGEIASEWKRDGERLALNISIPANTTATVFVPAPDPKSVMESGKPAANAPGVEFLRMEGNAAIYEIGSGTYQFTAGLPR